MLQELRVGEQRYGAWEVLEGASVTEVARRFGVSRQSGHSWLTRYAAGGGLGGLGDRSSRPHEGRYSRDYAGASPTGDDSTGRGLPLHTAGWNSGTVGMALLGTLTTHDATPNDATPAARDALTPAAGLGSEP